MNKLLVMAGVMVFGLLMAPVSWAIIIIQGGVYNGTNVGAVDVFIDQRTQVMGPGGSSPGNETNWVNEVLGAGTATFQVRDGDVALHSTNTTDVFAFFMDSPLHG